MATFDLCDIAEMNTFIGFADNGKIGKILRCAALILTANFARAVFLANQTGW